MITQISKNDYTDDSRLLRFARNDKGQTTLEYAVVIACIVGALIAMKPYVTRAIQGRLRRAADQIGEQYEPRKTTTGADGLTTTIDRDVTTEITSGEYVTITIDGKEEEGYATLRTETIKKDEVIREGTETVAAF